MTLSHAKFSIFPTHHFSNMIFNTDCNFLCSFVTFILIKLIDAQSYSNSNLNSGNSLNTANNSYRIYSKSSSSWKTFTYNEADLLDSDTQGAINIAEISDLIHQSFDDSTVKTLSSPEQCARRCKPGAKPKNCYYHWTFEYYHTLGGACQRCHPSTNTSLNSNCQCILADGVDVSGIIVANRMYPGPSVQVCLGDMVIVDVQNKIVGNELTIHWHGIFQEDWQHYDGVPFVTQCPIPSGTTFRYQFRAQNSGTHFWHAHTGLHKAEGVDGAIVIRIPEEDQPNERLYDVDDPDNIIFISDWLHRSAAEHFPGKTNENVGQDPDNFLINGRGQWTDPETGNRTTTPLTTINVQEGLRYRFRIINACAFNCPIQLTIQSHNFTIIALDGESVVPQEGITTITMFDAERVDVVFHANQPVGTYWIQVKGLQNCIPLNLQQHAVLHYVGSKLKALDVARPAYSPGLPRGIIFNDVGEICNGSRKDAICVQNLQSSDPVHKNILRASSDFQVFLTFTLDPYNNSQLYGNHQLQRFIDPEGSQMPSFTARMSGISYVFPPFPLISQLEDIPRGQLCNSNNLPEHCKNSTICHCTHVVDIPLNAVVDIILVDGAPNGISHPFHLHGYGFHVMAQGLLSKVNLTSANKHRALQLHQRAYGSIQQRPPTKDTLAVASGGYTIVRFIADNPGWWLYHCHFLPHLFNGMSLVLHVGTQNDLPPTPKGFPTCGNFMPNIYKSNPIPRNNVVKRAIVDNLQNIAENLKSNNGQYGYQPNWSPQVQNHYWNSNRRFNYRY